MIAGIYGKIVNILPSEVYISTNSGIIYLVNISLKTFKEIRELKEVSLVTEYVANETSQKLYGFSSNDELALFKTLIKVPKVGHTTALSITGEFSYKDLYEIVTNKDAKELSKVKGLGLKSATNIISHLENNDIITPIKEDELKDDNFINSIKKALETLGFSLKDYKDLLSNINKDLTLEENVKNIIKGIK